MAKNSERAHNRAKHNVGTWSRPKDMTAAQDDAQTAWRRDYFRNARPDLDPQSTTSKIMEFFGADTPYAQNAQSYDYRQKAWDDSVKSGNPDMSWSLPAADSFKFWGDEVDGRIPTQAEASEALGRGATPDEIAAAREVMADPRTRDEKNAGTALAALDFPLFGMGDETLAAAMSATGRGTYDDELALARGIQDRWEGNEPIIGPRGVTGLAGGLVGGLAPAGALWSGVGKATSLAAKPVTALGRGAKATADAGAAGGTDFGLWGLGHERGSLSERASKVEPETIGGGAAFGVIAGPVAGALGAAPAAAGRAIKSQSKRIGQAVAKRMAARGEQASARAPHDAPTPKPDQKPKPRATPQEPGDVRGDIEQAFRRRRK